MRLYQFWDSLRNAPDDVKVIKNDLMLLTNVLGDIAQEKDLSPAVRLTLESCQDKVKVSDISFAKWSKIAVLKSIQEPDSIVREFDSKFTSSTSKRERLWTALRVTTKSQQFQKFREALSSVRSTLMLKLMYQK